MLPLVKVKMFVKKTTNFMAVLATVASVKFNDDAIKDRVKIKMCE